MSVVIRMTVDLTFLVRLKNSYNLIHKPIQSFYNVQILWWSTLICFFHHIASIIVIYVVKAASLEVKMQTRIKLLPSASGCPRSLLRFVWEKAPSGRWHNSLLWQCLSSHGFGLHLKLEPQNAVLEQTHTKQQISIWKLTQICANTFSNSFSANRMVITFL